MAMRAEADLIVAWLGIGSAVIEVKGRQRLAAQWRWRQLGGAIDKRIHPVDQSQS